MDDRLLGVRPVGVDSPAPDGGAGGKARALPKDSWRGTCAAFVCCGCPGDMELAWLLVDSSLFPVPEVETFSGADELLSLADECDPFRL